MTTVDSKGRIVLPKEIRDRFGLTPGTEVVVEVKEGNVLLEPEDSPESILQRMESLIESASANRQRPSTDPSHPLAEKHGETIRRGARQAKEGDE